MGLLDGCEVFTIDDLSKGLDAYGDVTETEKGHYPEADNLTLVRKVPSTVGGLTRFSTTAAPNSETIIYAVPFSLVGSATEHLVYTSAGVWYKLASDVYTQLRTGLSTAPPYLSHAPFRGRLVVANGVDAVQSWDGSLMLPVGSTLACDMSISAAGPRAASMGAWTGGINETTLVRQGTDARRLVQVGAGTANMFVSFSALNYLVGPQSGDPDFNAAAAGDALRAQVNGVAGAANITQIDFVFTTSAGNFRTLTATNFALGWNAVSIARAAAVSTGAPNWASITRFDINMITTGDATIVVDDVLMQYITNPVPVGNIVTLYNNFLLIADQTADRVRVNTSSVTQIDDFPTANFVRITGGGHSLEQADQIKAMRVYSSVVVIGKSRSIHALSGTPGNLTVDVATVESGIDGHNSMVESPFALLYIYGNRINAFRLTAREPISQPIGPLLMTTNNGGVGPGLDLATAQRHVAIRHDETHTIRWSFAEVGSATNTLQLWYDYDRNAWLSEILYAVRHYYHTLVSGAREVHVVQYDGFLRRAEVGTDFDGTAIASRLLLPWVAGPRKSPGDLPAVVHWVGAILLLDGTADVILEYRVADTPAEATGAFSTAEGSPLDANAPNAEKGLVTFGNAMGRFIQLRARTTSGTMEVHPPVFLYYRPVGGRRGP